MCGEEYGSVDSALKCTKTKIWSNIYVKNK